MNKIIDAMYEDGAIRLRSVVIKLGRKLPLRNRSHIRFVLMLPEPRDPVTATRGIIRVPKRIARLIAESPEFSVLNS